MKASSDHELGADTARPTRLKEQWEVGEMERPMMQYKRAPLLE
jgi:hypothetical protein